MPDRKNSQTQSVINWSNPIIKNREMDMLNTY